MGLGKQTQETQDEESNDSHGDIPNEGAQSVADFKVSRRHAAMMVVTAGMLSSPLDAHEFWLDPATHRAEVGATVGIQLRVGQEFRGSAQPYLSRDIAAFRHISATQDSPITGLLGDSRPAAKVTVVDGLNTVTHLTTPFLIDFRPTESIWENYLQLDGLNAQVAAHPEIAQIPPLKERYVRSAKTLIVATNTAPTALDRDGDLPFELVLASPPSALAPGAHRFQITTNNQPTPGILVKAFRASDRQTVDQATSDATGWVSLTLPSADRYLISGVRIDPDPSDQADWLSYWASLTLEVLPTAP